MTPAAVRRSAAARRSAAVLRSDAVLLAGFGLSGLALDLLGYAAGVGSWGRVLQGNPLAVGVVEAHGLAVIVAALLFRYATAPATGAWHVTAIAVHVLLGTCNLAFWEIFVVLGAVPLGVLATAFHASFVVANALALALSARQGRAARPFA